MTSTNGTPEARALVAAWIAEERATYADKKWVAENSDLITRLLDEDWEAAEQFALNYLSRVRLFGLNTKQGRQALGKMVVTLTNYLERACDSHGMMPRPGVSSGNVDDWLDYPERGYFPT